MQLFKIRKLYEVDESRERFLTKTLTPNVNFIFTMDEPTLQTILPSVSHGGLELTYNSNQPEFLSSILHLNYHYYHLFGWFSAGFLAIFYFIKGVVIIPQGKDKGQLIAHILLLKTPVFAVYPTYSELIDYCQGFMIADLPWLNSYFG